MSEDPALQDELLLISAGWPQVLDRILQGLGHDLNNRVQSLLSLVQLFQIDDDTDAISPFLEKEVDQLEEAVMLLRLIPADPGEVEELIHLPDVISQLVAINRVQKHLEITERTLDVEKEGLMPVRARWSQLNRAVLVLLAAGAWEGSRRDRLAVIRLYPEGDALVLEVESPGPIQHEPPVESARVDGLARLVEAMGGAFSEHFGDDGATMTMRLTTAGAGG